MLAPMEDVTDRSFRLMCKEQGASMVYTEFVSADALIRDIPATTRKLSIDPAERPTAIQIYGREIEPMVEAAKIVEVAGKGAGAGMLRDIPKMLSITRAVVDAVKLPVTVKTRLGWDHESKIIVELAEQLQDCGIKALTVHGRTRSQMYGGKADWKKIAELKRNVDIPVFANGDVVSIETAVQCLEESEADGVAIGRGALGDPSLLYRVETYLNKGEYLPSPTLEEKIETLKRHLLKEVEFRGEIVGIKFCRKFFPYYVNGFQGASRMRGELVLMEDLKEIFNKLDGILISAAHR